MLVPFCSLVSYPQGKCNMEEKKLDAGSLGVIGDTPDFLCISHLIAKDDRMEF
jgi:hypothetical protein